MNLLFCNSTNVYVIILTHKDLNEPDAGNCTVNPVVEPRISEEGQSKSVVIGIDCSKARDSNQLLFQLSISRNKGLNSNSKRGDENQLNTRKLLFAQSKPDQQAKGDQNFERSQFSISDIIEWDKRNSATNVTTTQSDETKDDVTQNDQGFNLLARNFEENVELSGGNGADNRARFGFHKRGKTTSAEVASSRLITLDEQVDLLKELVFTIRASNLIKTSAPHAIYGSELKLIEADNLLNNQSDKPLPISNHSITGSTQVSRSTTNQLDNSFEDGSSITLHSSILSSNISAVRQNNNSRQPLAGNSLPNIPITNWIHHNEISITIAAIFATVILSLLTLTLIVLVLRNRKEVQKHTVCVIDDHSEDNNSLASHTTNNRVKLSRPIIANESVELKEGVFFDGNSMMRFKAFNGEPKQQQQQHILHQSTLDLGWKTLPANKCLAAPDNIKLDETTSYIDGIDFLAPAVCNGSLMAAHQEDTDFLNSNNNKHNKQQPALIYAPNYPSSASTSTSPPQLQPAIYSGSNLSLSQLEDQTTTLLTATTTTTSQHRTAPTVVDCNHHHHHHHHHSNQNLQLDSEMHSTRCDNMYLFSFF